ncbi:MAG TPA: ATP-binding protein, partial [Burkholderiaceae bacterium]|nr:ATP-binding protein [Burkholderiaceae bacterium]
IATLLPQFESRPPSSCGITYETPARTRTGTTIPVEVSVSPVTPGDLSVLVVRDVSLRKETEQHLIAARDAAEAARATQARFLANMSHELRTPLNAVMGYAQVLLYQSTLTERQRLAASTIRNSGEHLLALITDLLDLAKSDAGKLELCPTPFRLADFLRVTSDIVRVKAEEARLGFRCEIDPDAPASIVADEPRLRQVLLNLLSNAVKFTDSGDVVLSVHVLQRHAGRVRLRFGVRDTGVGIRDDQLEAIFRPFEQVGEVRHRAAGTGLGLAISRQLVRAMGGELGVSSAPGKGSHFAFELEVPLAPDAPAPEATPTASCRRSGPAWR